jgi:predicted MFS family arabinose efflux permease
MIAVLRQRNYALLWTAQLISMIGNWALIAALPFFIYDLTGSVLATGAMFMIQIVPPLLFGSVAGVFVDRWDRRWTMIGATLIQAAVLVMLLTVRASGTVWLVYVAGFLESVASQFFGPANNALLPRLVGGEHLLQANALDAFGENGARLAGPALGGMLLAASGLPGVVIFDIFSYLIAALLMYFIAVPPLAEAQAPAGEQPAASGALKAIWEEFVAGVRLVVGQPALSRMFLIIGVALLGDSMLTVLLVAFLEKVVGVGSVEFGWLLTIRGLGGILGGLAVGRLSGKISIRQLVGFGLLGTGVLLLTMIAWPILWVAAVTIVLVGFPVMAWLISSQTWLQKYAPDKYRGRVFGAYGTTSALLMLIGMAFASGVGDSLGIVNTLVIAGAIYLVSGVLGLALLREQGASPRPKAA